MQARKFANLCMGLFFLISSISLAVLMIMFVFVWQPIWTEGFKDFHNISDAIGKLNETAKPSAEIAPQMLTEITKMNVSMKNMEDTMVAMTEIRSIMADMGVSMKSLEDINPNIIEVNKSVDHMGRMISGEMGKMNYEVNNMSDRFSPMGMMPFNW